MFYQDCHESFKASERSAVNHYWPGRLVVFSDITQIKSFMVIVINLNWAELPFSPQGTLHNKIKLWAVKSCFAFFGCKGKFCFLQNLFNVFFGFFPVFIAADVF